MAPYSNTPPTMAPSKLAPNAVADEPTVAPTINPGTIRAGTGDRMDEGDRLRGRGVRQRDRADRVADPGDHDVRSANLQHVSALEFGEQAHRVAVPLGCTARIPGARWA